MALTYKPDLSKGNRSKQKKYICNIDNKEEREYIVAHELKELEKTINNKLDFLNKTFLSTFEIVFHGGKKAKWVSIKNNGCFLRYSLKKALKP